MNRIKYLDSVRGIAALMVVIYHVINAHWGYYTISKLSFFVINGVDAVSLFFVLSGLVLSYKYLQKPNIVPEIQYKNFVIGRFFRLYPVYLVVLIILYIQKHQDVLMSKVFISDIVHNRDYLAQYVLLVRGYLDKICTPAWSLAVEIALSLMVPLLIIVLRTNKQMFLLFIPLLLFANKFYYNIFVLHFMLGILITNNFEYINNCKQGAIYKYRYILLLASFLLFSWRIILMLHPLPYTIQKIVDEVLYLDTYIITGIGAAGILVFIINSERIQKILSIKPLLFLGKISYSMYLCHWIFPVIIMSNWELLKNKIGENNMFLFMLFFVLIATLLCATFLYYAVEMPFIKLGKKWASKKLNK